MFDSVSREGSLNPMTGFMSFFGSLAIHAVVVSLLMTVPLIFMRSLPLKTLTYLYADPPMPVIAISPPPTHFPEKPTGSSSGGGAIFKTGIPPEILRTPTAIPKGIPAPPDEIPVFTGMAGVGESFLFENPAAESGNSWGMSRFIPPPLPKPPERPTPVRIGTLEPSRLIRKIEPVYPELARRARISGAVRLEAIIDEEGRVTDVKVLSGDRTLCEAAVDAVKQWRYTPTVQNGEPVPILAIINVVFKLH